MDTRTAFFPVLLIPLLFVTACSGEQSTEDAEPERREEVIERYEGGEKRVVAVYKGTGKEESLVERITYGPSGQRIKVENLAQDTTLTFEDLQTQYESADSLQAYLTRTAWINAGNEVDGESTTGVDIYTPDSLYKIIQIGDFSRRISYSVDYLDGFRVRRDPGGVDEPTTTRIHLRGPDEINYGDKDNKEGIYRRVKLDNMQSLMLRKAVKELQSE